jgi:hypothetical protein
MALNILGYKLDAPRVSFRTCAIRGVGFGESI